MGSFAAAFFVLGRLVVLRLLLGFPLLPCLRVLWLAPALGGEQLPTEWVLTPPATQTFRFVSLFVSVRVLPVFQSVFIDSLKAVLKNIWGKHVLSHPFFAVLCAPPAKQQRPFLRCISGAPANAAACISLRSN